jgi:hypothetical protein
LRPLLAHHPIDLLFALLAAMRAGEGMSAGFVCLALPSFL